MTTRNNIYYLLIGSGLGATISYILYKRVESKNDKTIVNLIRYSKTLREVISYKSRIFNRSMNALVEGGELDGFLKDYIMETEFLLATSDLDDPYRKELNNTISVAKKALSENS